MAKHIIRLIRLERERKRLDEVALSLGHDSTEKMLYELYIVKGMPIETISKTLVTPMWTLRKRFDEAGISVRTRGGLRPSTVLTELTPDLISELMRDGVRAVADRLGVDPPALSAKLRVWYKKTGGKF